MSSKALDKMSADELREAIDAVDEKIGAEGTAIAKARKTQRGHLDRKDDLVNALNARLRADGPNLTISGDDRG